ncbi:CzcC family cobalt/zinc/cadmium efflux transporter outer membrane protein, partial [Pseudomonas syringae pv. japonica str. M301072]
MRVAALCLVLLPLVAPGIAAAQVMSLAQALEAAFARNPELAAAQWEIGVAEGDRQQAGLIPNPTVSWEVEDTRRET